VRGPVRRSDAAPDSELETAPAVLVPAASIMGMSDEIVTSPLAGT
jgi:hypothetical protein